MAFWGLSWVKAKQLADVSANNINAVINERFADINERLRKIENIQKETSLQLDAMDEALHGSADDSENEKALVDVLITLMDTIGDFFHYAASVSDTALYEQARMMWDSAINTAKTTEVQIINPFNEPFNFLLHSAESADHDINLPNGYVIKTLKCGFIYREKIVRRASVIVNKLTASHDNENRSSNIIYFRKEEDQ